MEKGAEMQAGMRAEAQELLLLIKAPGAYLAD